MAASLAAASRRGVSPVVSRRRARAQPFGPEAVIIHEMLHSLGLGKNPPTSGEIMLQVRG